MPSTLRDQHVALGEESGDDKHIDSFMKGFRSVKDYENLIQVQK